MKQFKKCQVVMLPTKQKSKILRNTYKFTPEHGNPLEYGEIENAEERGYEYQHLYILSDDEIKANDYWLNVDTICKDFKNYSHILISKASVYDADTIKKNKYTSCKKIIATTDLEINRKKIYHISQKGVTHHQDEQGTFNYEWIVPKLSKNFVEAYVRHGGDIKDVQVKCIIQSVSNYAKNKIDPKYEFVLGDQSTVPGNYYLTTEDGMVQNLSGDGFALGKDIALIPKVDSKNEITIISVQDTLKKSEILDLFKKFVSDVPTMSGVRVFDETFFNKWIQENLNV